MDSRSITGILISMKQNWYFQGWQKQPYDNDNGKLRYRYVYTGEYYKLANTESGVFPFKIINISLILIFAALWVFASLQASTGIEKAYTGAAWFLNIIPLIYLFIGGTSLLFVKDKMTYRDVRGAFRRIKFSAVFSLIFCTLALAGQVFFLITATDYQLGTEIIYAVCLALCIIINISLLYMQYRFPITMLPSQRSN